MPKERPKSVKASTSVAREATGQGPDPARRGHEGGRLAGDGPRVVVLAAPHLERGVHLGHLALAQLPQGGGQQAGDLGAQGGGDLGRAGQQEVAGHDGHEVAETGVDALHVAPHGGLVHDVVVVQRRQVDQLDGHRPEQVLPGGDRGPGCGGGQGQDRPEPLAPGGQEVGGDLVEEAVAGDHGVHEQGLEALQLIFECGKPEEFDDVHFLQTIGQDADDGRKWIGIWVRAGVGTTGTCRLRFSY